MKKKILIMLLLILLTGCAKSEDDYPMEYIGNNVYIFVDKKTGVNYLVYCGYKSGGITPRFNKDGSLYIEKEWNKNNLYGIRKEERNTWNFMKS